MHKIKFLRFMMVVLLPGLMMGCASLGQPAMTTPAPLPATETALPAATMPPTASRPADSPSPAGDAATVTPPPVQSDTPAPTPSAPEPEPTVLVATAEPSVTAEPDIAATLVAGGAPRLYASYPSPDGALRAEVLIHDCAPLADGQEYAYDRLQVTNAATDETWFIDGQLQACGGLGAFGLAGLFWSPSGRFFYYTEAREGVPDGCGYWSRPISRVDVADRTTADLGGGPLSPDGTRLAVWDERDLVVYEIDGDEIGRVAAASPQAALGPIVWSPEGDALVYLQAAMFCIAGESGATSVVRVEVPALTSEILLRSTSPALQSVAWDAPIALDLVDDTGARWQYDFYSEELTRLP